MKYTIDKVREIFTSYNYELISSEYINTTTPLEYICNTHRNKGVQKITLKALNSGQRCPYCTFEEGKSCNFKLPDDIYQDETEKRGYIFNGIHKENGFIMIDFVCKKHRDYGLQTSKWHDIKSDRCCCKVCNGNDRDSANFAKMVKEKLPNIDVIGEYTGARNRVKVRCSNDGYEWEPYAYNLLNGYGCPICHHRKVGALRKISKADKLEKLQSMHPDIQFLEVPELARDNVHCKCNECGTEWYASYDNLTKSKNPTGCPRCSKSKGEKKIASLLKEWGYEFEIEKTFPELKDIDLLRFDFYLPDYNLLIEYDGEYHYGPIYISKDIRDMTQREKEYGLLKKHDEMKNKYCKDNKIPLLRIPYWDYSDIDYMLFDFMVKHRAIVEL